MKFHLLNFFTALFFLFLWGHLFPPAPVQAADIRITVNNCRISLQAEKQPLIELLKVLSSKTGVIVKTGRSLSGQTSCVCNNVDVERCFRSLLKKHDYALIYTKTENGTDVLQEIRIPGDQPLASIATFKKMQQQPRTTINQDVAGKKVNRHWFAKNLKDKEHLLKQISVRPDSRGVRIASLQKDSFFSKIGLSKGDIVESINGISVWTINDLLEAMGPHVSNRSIGIQCVEAEGNIKPLYIHLVSASPLDMQMQKRPNVISK